MIYLPLEHIDDRYTKHLDRDILRYLHKKNISYTYLEPRTIGNGPKEGMFLDAIGTTYRQFYQMQELIRLLAEEKVASDETLFVTDLWNFALMAVPYLNFFCNYKLKVHGIIHSGSFTDTDFVRQMERVYKGFEESLFDICDKIYLGSNFIKKDIIQKRYVKEDKLIVTGLPLDFESLDKYKGAYEKENLIVFTSRNVDEKQPHLFDDLQKRLPQYKYINTQREHVSKQEYFKILARAKCMVSFALQEGFGYSVQEAVTLGCVPVLPNRLAYMEQFLEEYRYNSFDECVEMVERAMEGNLLPTTPTVTDNDKIFDVWFKDFQNS